MVLLTDYLTLLAQCGFAGYVLYMLLENFTEERHDSRADEVLFVFFLWILQPNSE